MGLTRDLGRIKGRGVCLTFTMPHDSFMIDLMDVKAHRPLHTQCNCQECNDRVCAKLDTVMVNAAWLSMIPEDRANYSSCGISDHTYRIVETHRVEVSMCGLYMSAGGRKFGWGDLGEMFFFKQAKRTKR
ncbi:hypothetical protein Ancab_004161 [Ancistrocladus abbreviatus]